MHRVLLTASLVLALGCDKSPPPVVTPPQVAAPPPATPPPVAAATPKSLTATWGSTGRNLAVSGEGLKRTEVSVYISDGALQVSGRGFPGGSVLVVDGVEVSLAALGRQSVPLHARIATLPWAALKPEPYRKGQTPLPRLPLPVTLRVPGFVPFETELPALPVGTGLDRFFIELATTGKRWPDEVPASVPAAAAWAFNDFDALGEAPAVRDVRLVVLGERSANTRTRKCSGYAGAKDFIAGSYDVELRIVDRLTRDELAKRVFTGQPACPTAVVATNGVASWAEGPPRKVMTDWVASQLKPLSKKLEPAAP